MKIGKMFNLLSISEYKHYIVNHKKYIDFNTLGLFRSILENDKLNISDKVLIRDFANRYFQKTFDFLQIKDPFTFFELITLDKDLTKADENQIWNEIKTNQEKILKSKRIRNRNFGIYSKHLCGYETCYLNGLLIERGSFFTEHEMQFDFDKNKYSAKIKSERQRIERKKEKKIINAILNLETQE